MRVPITMIDVVAVSFVDPTLLFKMATSFIAGRSPLFLFVRTMVLAILFIVISSHPAN